MGTFFSDPEYRPNNSTVVRRFSESVGICLIGGTPGQTRPETVSLEMWNVSGPYGPRFQKNRWEGPIIWVPERIRTRPALDPADQDGLAFLFLK